MRQLCVCVHYCNVAETHANHLTTSLPLATTPRLPSAYPVRGAALQRVASWKDYWSEILKGQTVTALLKSSHSEASEHRGRRAVLDIQPSPPAASTARSPSSVNLELCSKLDHVYASAVQPSNTVHESSSAPLPHKTPPILDKGVRLVISKVGYVHGARAEREREREKERERERDKKKDLNRH